MRAWSERKHADAFLRDGRLRLRRVQHYQTIEEASRADASEGNAHILVPGHVPVVTLDRETLNVIGQHTMPGHFNYQMSLGNPTYVLCLSDSEVSLNELTSRFGEHVVEIFSPRALFDSLHASVRSLEIGDRTVGWVDCFSIRYDKGLVGPEPRDEEWRMRIAYGQKPPAFAVEREVRCAVILSGASTDAPEFLDVRLGDVSSFTRAYIHPPGAV